jgi:hypothetical protein
MLAVVGSETSFEHGREELELLAGLQVTTKAVERQAEAIGADIAQKEQVQSQRAKQLELPEVIGPPVPVLYIEMDGTQVPMVRSELEGRAGRAPGQPARTREVKLGCVFTQTATDEQGRPVRDEASTTYTGAIESAEEFGHRLYTEAWERGWSRAAKKVIIGDGAEWIWNIAEQHFPGATQIVDLYHARQHLWELARALYPSRVAKEALGDGSAKQTGWRCNRKACALSAKSGNCRSTVGGQVPGRGRLLRTQRSTHALSEIPRAKAIRWFWCH